MAEILQYKCPCCGGTIGFDSSLQKLKCPYCDTEFDVQTLKNYDDVLKNDSGGNMNWNSSAGGEWQAGEEDGMRVYVCKSCGGEIVTDENTSATNCPWCGNNVVLTGNLSGSLKPDIVIPFKLDKATAKAKYLEHLKRKRLLPKIFMDENHIDEIKGMYVPFWLFDANVDAFLHFRATRTRAWSDKRYDYVETSHYSVQRAGTMNFDGVPVDGSSKIPDDMMESIEPFNLNEAVDFQTAYLAGFFADKYDVDAQSSIERANSRVRLSTEQTLASTVQGFETVTPDGGNINLKNGIAKYALYPVWFLNTSWNGNKYMFAMNGQTGKFVGDLPLDKKAYWRWFGIVAAIGAVITYGGVWLAHLLNLI